MKHAALVLAGMMFYASPAMAEPLAINMPAPNLSETDEARPDWYEQFTFSTGTPGTESLNEDTSKSLRLSWVKNERWSLSVDLTQRAETPYLTQVDPLSGDQVSAEAYFLITPRISVGGQLSVGADDLNDEQARQDILDTSIRLRSAFRF